jgi:hydrogenase expression/formation protein HypE
LSELNIGKITTEELIKYVFPFTGKKNSSVLIGPAVGEDAAVITLGKIMLILKIDPVSGALDKIGFESVHINANDVAAKGATPKYFLVSLILPKHYNFKQVEKIMRQIHEASLEIGVSVVGGHTEFTDGLTHPIVVGSMVGVVEDKKYFSVRNTNEGDLLVLTKTAGIEATSIIAEDLEAEIQEKFGTEFVNKAKEFTKNISIVKEAKLAKKILSVIAMHDCTEGGVISAAFEIAQASDKGLLIWEDKIPVAYETKELAKLYDLNPIEIISSGSLIIAVKPSSKSALTNLLKENQILASVIGEIKNKKFGRKIRKSDGVLEDIKIPDKDPIWKLLNKIVKEKKKRD